MPVDVETWSHNRLERLARIPFAERCTDRRDRPYPAIFPYFQAGVPWRIRWAGFATCGGRRPSVQPIYGLPVDAP